MKEKCILQMETGKMIWRRPRNKPFLVRYPYRRQLEGVFLPNRNGGLVWYNDRSKIQEDPGAEVYGNGTKRKFCLRQYTMVFQAHVQQTIQTGL
jgi:hypothetical protein